MESSKGVDERQEALLDLTHDHDGHIVGLYGNTLPGADAAAFSSDSLRADVNGTAAEQVSTTASSGCACEEREGGNGHV